MLSNLSDSSLKNLKEYVYNYKANFRDSLCLSDFIQFGCEVEFNSDLKTNFYRQIVDKKYTVKKDLSGKDIVEIITPIMYNTVSDWSSFRDMISNLPSAKIMSDTGGHIHFDHSIINDENILYFLKFWYVFEDIIYDFSSGEFDNIRPSHFMFAQKLKDIVNFIDLIETGYIPLNNLDFYGKKYGLNLSNHFNNKNINKDTYEIRVPNSSLDINIWQNNVEFFASLLLFANNNKNHDYINELYKDKVISDTFENRLLLADLIYNCEESKIRFLNQFTLDRKYEPCQIKKNILSLGIR